MNSVSLSSNGIVFVGDVHRQWQYVMRGLARLARPPQAMVLLGDMECDAPLDDLVASVRADGTEIYWIAGNHDYDGGSEMLDNLVDPARNPVTVGNGLHGRVVEIAGLRVAGLSGTFRPRIWLPPSEPKLHGRAGLADNLATLGPGWREEQLAALHRSLAELAIWPEDFAHLSGQRADILVTHEAPSSHPMGFAVIDALARAMGARLILHGHHHVTYRARATDGLLVQGVAAGWGVAEDGSIAWEGEAPRWMCNATIMEAAHRQLNWPIWTVIE